MTVADSGERLTPPSMVGRMTLILDAFERRSSRLNLEEIATRTGLPRSTTHRILEQLVALEWLDHTPPGYRLGRRALRLAGPDTSHADIRGAAVEYLLELHARTGMVVHLAALDGADEVYLDKIGGRFATSIESRIGSRRPAHATTGGRAMLAWLAPEEVDGLVRGRVGDVPGADGWDLGGLHQELHRIRRAHGLSFDRGERAELLVGRRLPSVATAVRGPRGPVAAICLCGDERAPGLQRVAPLVADTARRVVRDLFGESQVSQLRVRERVAG